MKNNLKSMSLAIIFALMIGCGPASKTMQPPQNSWYFAVSGDSRDCGDLIMPKIAASVESIKHQTPVEFFWHLGDFRKMHGIDCDMIRQKYPDYDCKHNPVEGVAADEMKNYLDTAWDDFIEHQLAPFGQLPVFLVIGNHELYSRFTRNEYRQKFRTWLTQEPIRSDSIRHGETYYHFVKHNAAFICLDNADKTQFDTAQMNWLEQVLNADIADKKIKTIIVGMHAALPRSKAGSHGMEAFCQGDCSGQAVYEMLYKAQSAGKRVYVLSAHSHYYQENIFDTAHYHGKVLPGWTIGTAGAQQYLYPSFWTEIRYGYALIEIRGDGTMNLQFVPITRDMPPLASGKGAEGLTQYCFEQNHRTGKKDSELKSCVCDKAK